MKNALIAYNEAYRKGKPVISDQEYDSLMEELEKLSPNDELLNKVGLEVMDDDRKERLPIIMASMNKIKTIEALLKWARLKDIPLTTEVVLTGKYDGLSLCAKELSKKAWTRGDGIFGQRSDYHFSHIIKRSEKISNILNGKQVEEFISFGEAIMSRQNFEKYSDSYSNPRNLVSGILNKKDANADFLKDVEYIRYGAIGDFDFKKKSELLDHLNSFQPVKVDYIVTTIADLTEPYLKKVYTDWNKEYELDGIIVEVNDLEYQEELGRETSSNNPVFARAYKGNFEELKLTTVLGITWNVSKQGYLKPIIQVDPINLDGVVVSNVTGNNARYIQEMGIGVGSEVWVKRSGMVIPLIVKVEKSTPVNLPSKCTSCSGEVEWNENDIELMCPDIMCSGQRLRRNISFFRTLDVENVSEGVVTQLYDAGYDTIEKILSMSQEDLLEIDRFGKRKAEIVHTAIHSKLSNVPLSKLQHATGLFKMLGSKKLALLEHFESKPSVNEIINIDGFSDKSAQAYIDAYDSFNEFIKDLPITVSRTEKIEPTSNELQDKVFVFTGVRDKEAEEVIVSKGGKVGSGVNKKTNYLVVKSKGSGSSKETKALSLGVEILTLEELKEML